MSCLSLEFPDQKSTERRFAIFCLSELLLAVDMHQVQEANRVLDVTPVPRAPKFVRGVINLRGDVVTVIDLRVLLGLPPAQLTRQSRNLIVRSEGELIGLWADGLADTITVAASDIEPTPSNFDDVESRFFEGVFKMEDTVVVILNLQEVLNGC